MSGAEHNRAYRAALNEVGEAFGGWRCEAGDCAEHGGEMGTIEWAGEFRVICQQHHGAWWRDPPRVNREIRAEQRRNLALLWGWGTDG